jgi:thiol-disulfide isomerase/thioredoxin
MSMVSWRSRMDWILASAVIGLLALSTACGSGGGFAVQAEAAGGGPTALDFTLNDLQGEQVQLSDSAGQVRLIDFWATWCAPCREEVPMLNELQASYGPQGFQILAISDEEADVIRDFVKDHEVEYLNLLGTEEVVEAFGVLGLPAAYLVDGEGRVVESFLGPKPRRVLVEKIESLLAAQPAT